MHKCRSNGLDKPDIRPFVHLTLNCDFDLHSTSTNTLSGTFTYLGEQMCHIFAKSMHKFRNNGLDKL